MKKEKLIVKTKTVNGLKTEFSGNREFISPILVRGKLGKFTHETKITIFVEVKFKEIFVRRYFQKHYQCKCQ